MPASHINTRAFQEGGAVASNIVRRVEVWGVDPAYQSVAGLSIPLAVCRDSTGYIYQVLQASAMGTSVPQVGETWLISRALGLWTFMARVSLPSPITQTVKASYVMQPSNRFVFGAPPSGTNWSVTLPNPITAVQGDVYGVRNTSGGGTHYTGTMSLTPFSSETIHGPSSFGAHSGGMFVSDNVSWFCIGDTTASGNSQIGGA
jgi:hypothetical protein